MRIILGIWFAISILLNAFGLWIGKIWNGSNPGWVLGFPLVMLIVSGCSAYGAIKPRGYLLLVGLLVYAGVWSGLAMDKWRVSILVISAVNFVAIILATKALNLLKT